MTYSGTCRLSAIAGRNQFAFKDILFTSALFVGIFGGAAAILSQLF